MSDLKGWELEYVEEQIKKVCYAKIRSVILINRIQKAKDEYTEATDLQYKSDIKDLEYYNKYTNTNLDILLFEIKQEIQCEFLKTIQDYKIARYAFIATEKDNGSYSIPDFCERYFTEKGNVDYLIQEVEDAMLEKSSKYVRQKRR